MAEISIVLRQWNNAKKADIVVNDSMTVSELLKNAISKWALPQAEKNQVYYIIYNGTEITDTYKTLAQIGVRDGDDLVLGVGFIPAASIIRLEKEYEKLKEFQKNSKKKIDIIEVSGNPPTGYLVRYYCKGIERLDPFQNPVFRFEHDVRITLKANHPMEVPNFKFETPFFHPNVYDTNKICTGGTGDEDPWKTDVWIDQYCLIVYEMIIYNPKYINNKSPANTTASNWAKKNMGLFPLLQSESPGSFFNTSKILNWVDSK